MVFLLSPQSTLHSQSPQRIPSRNPDIALRGEELRCLRVKTTLDLRRRGRLVAPCVDNTVFTCQYTTAMDSIPRKSDLYVRSRCTVGWCSTPSNTKQQRLCSSWIVPQIKPVTSSRQWGNEHSQSKVIETESAFIKRNKRSRRRLLLFSALVLAKHFLEGFFFDIKSLK